MDDTRVDEFKSLRAEARNPFSSCCIRPGSIPFVFEIESSADSLLSTLRKNHWRGQVVGPHGSGKSTLLQTLLPLLRREGLMIFHGTFRGGRLVWRNDSKRSAANVEASGTDFDGFAKPSSALGRRLVVIDGFEQLPLVFRWCWRLRSLLENCGLLVTAHRDMGLPWLYQTRVNRRLVEKVVERLVPPSRRGLITTADIDNALAWHPEDLRSVLFTLYDAYENRRRFQSSTPLAPGASRREGPQWHST